MSYKRIDLIDLGTGDCFAFEDKGEKFIYMGTFDYNGGSYFIYQTYITGEPKILKKAKVKQVFQFIM